VTARRGIARQPREVREVRAARSARLWERACAGNHASRASLCIARVVPRAPLPRGVTNRHPTRAANAPTANDHRRPPRGVPGQPPAPRHPGDGLIPALAVQHRAATPRRHVIQRERPQSEPGIPHDPPSGAARRRCALAPPAPRPATDPPHPGRRPPTRPSREGGDPCALDRVHAHLRRLPRGVRLDRHRRHTNR
jgi:hypothetical protein